MYVCLVDNSISEEITHRIEKGNRAYYAYKGLITSKLINKCTKWKIYMTLIGPVVTYACETWTLFVQHINNVLVCERQFLRKVFGPFHCQEGWRMRSNDELQKLIKGEVIGKCIKAQTIKNGMDILTEWKIEN